MFAYFWQTFLYQPLFNVLIWLYSNVAGQNLGWAVIWLTIFLRILLLPLTIIAERNVMKEEQARLEAEKAVAAYRHDSVGQKEAIRKIMKKHHLSPWAKTATLLIQLLVLVLLYQVFIRGISGEKVIKLLYSWVDYPGKPNILFYGFDIGRVHDSLWAGIAAIYLFTSILIEGPSKKNNWQKSEVFFLFLFPLFTFTILWILPMVKSLFILTTMIFSDTIRLLRKAFFPVKKAEIK